MFKLSFIILLLSITACNHQQKSQIHTSSTLSQSKNTFNSCFTNLDTSKAGKSIACCGGTYKLINDKYVIHIYPDLAVQFDSCYTITIDSINGKQITQLMIFDHKDANLTNICTDVILIDNPEPTRKLNAVSGELIVGFSNPTILYGNPTYHTSILIKRLEFIDSTTGQKIIIENELLWKVLDLGTPG